MNAINFKIFENLLKKRFIWKYFANSFHFENAVTYWGAFETSMMEPFAKVVKACVHYFLKIFYFQPNDSSSKTMKKCFLFYLKSFRSRDIQIFVFLSSHLFLPLSHCVRDCLKINLKACVRYFSSSFYFSPNDSLQKLWKMFFISSNKLFSFLRYSNFCVFVFPSFFPCQPLL